MDRYADLDLVVAKKEYAKKLEIPADLIIFTCMVPDFSRPGVLSATELRTHIASIISHYSEPASRLLESNGLALTSETDESTVSV